MVNPRKKVVYISPAGSNAGFNARTGKVDCVKPGIDSGDIRRRNRDNGGIIALRSFKIREQKSLVSDNRSADA